MRKVKCGIENAEWRWFVETSNHLTAVIRQYADYHTGVTINRTGDTGDWLFGTSAFYSRQYFIQYWVVLLIDKDQ